MKIFLPWNTKVSMLYSVLKNNFFPKGKHYSYSIHKNHFLALKLNLSKNLRTVAKFFWNVRLRRAKYFLGGNFDAMGYVRETWVEKGAFFSMPLCLLIRGWRSKGVWRSWSPHVHNAVVLGPVPTRLKNYLLHIHY